MTEAAHATAPDRPETDGGFTITIDDDETVEVDDALSCERLPDGSVRARVHIALVADFVAKDGPMDREAAQRATTVYLPEITVRMLPDTVSCQAASLIAGEVRPVLTTDVIISPTGEVVEASIYPARIKISQRLDYDRADRILGRSGILGRNIRSARAAQPRGQSVARTAPARRRIADPAARSQGSRAGQRHPDRGN